MAVTGTLSRHTDHGICLQGYVSANKTVVHAVSGGVAASGCLQTLKHSQCEAGQLRKACGTKQRYSALQRCIDEHLKACVPPQNRSSYVELGMPADSVRSIGLHKHEQGC